MTSIGHHHEPEYTQFWIDKIRKIFISLEQDGEKGSDENVARPDPEDGRFEDAGHPLVLLQARQEADVGGCRHRDHQACQDHHCCGVDVEGAPEELIFTQSVLST